MTDAEFAESVVPKGRDSFRVSEIAESFAHSSDHVNNLIDAGAIAVIDPKAKKSMRRVARAELVRFIASRVISPASQPHNPTPEPKKRTHEKSKPQN